MDQPPSVPEPQPAQPSPAPTSLASRLLNVLVTPGEVFDEVKAAAASVGNWLVPTLIYGVIAATAYVILFTQPAILQKMHEDRAKVFDKYVQAGAMTREKADQALAAQEKMFGPVVMGTLGGFGGFVQSFIELFFWAFLLWLIGRVCLKSRISFTKTIELAGLASIIAALEAVLRTLLVITTSNPLASPSLSLLVKNPSPQNKLFVVLGLVNPVIFWLLAVRSIGLAKFCGVSSAKAAAWVFSIWLLLMGAVVGGSLALQAAFAK